MLLAVEEIQFNFYFLYIFSFAINIFIVENFSFYDLHQYLIFMFRVKDVPNLFVRSILSYYIKCYSYFNDIVATCECFY